MQGLFSPNSPLMRIMSRIADLMILNLIFLITCVPIVTIGAASAALYTVAFRLGTVREAGVVKPYFAAFRENFRQATPVWLIILLCGGATAFNTALCYTLTGPIRWVGVVFAVLFVVVLLVHALAFPLVSLFRNDTRSTLKNALVLGLGYLPRSVLAAALNVLPFVYCLTDIYGFFRLGFLWAMLYFAGAAWANTYILKKVFAPYLPEDETREPF